jgi:hypothetical protein
VTPADKVFYWTIAIGEGLIVLMVTWLLAARASERLMPQPGAAIGALSLARIMGTAWSAYRVIRRIHHGSVGHAKVDGSR